MSTAFEVKKDPFPGMPLPVGRPLPFGKFLDGLELAGQVQPVAKLRVCTHSEVPHLKTPLVCADPPGDSRSLATGVIDSIVQHPNERVAHDFSG
jgi:hypothetical protein